MSRKKVFYFFLAGVLAYYILGFVLTGTGMVSKWWIYPGAMLMKESNQSENRSLGKDNDGPYLFYNQDHILIKTITKTDTSFLYNADTFKLEEKKNVALNCTFSDQSIPGFSVQLKDSLVNEIAEYPEAKKILALSDIEGNFPAFRNHLIGNGVIDSAYNWIFGNGHLVLDGDFFDRGSNVTEVLWLIYSLEEKARSQGGHVHFILGNHELMNLSGDLRYVNGKYFENWKYIREGYTNLFTLQTELGRWLSTKNIIEKVGNILFTHGGISEELNQQKLTLAEINALAKPNYFSCSQDRSNDEIIATIFNDETSPFWYRGYVEKDAEDKQVAETLEQYQVDCIVVGHTIVEKVSTFYDGKVIAIDTDHAGGTSEGLFVENKVLYSVNQEGERQPL